MEFIKKVGKHFQMAWKSVMAEKKEYACFFAAILLVQCLIGVCTVSYCNNNRIQKRAASGEYDYHFVMENLSENQFFYIVNVRQSEQEKDWIFDLKYQKRTLSNGSNRYQVYVTLSGSEENAAARYAEFLNRYDTRLTVEGGEVTYRPTPLLQYAKSVAGNRAAFVGLLLLCAVLSYLLLTILYRVRVDHFKFNYGVYLSFGADFKRLLSMSVCEMAVITALTFLPSLLLSYGVTALLYIPAGGLLSMNFLPLLTVSVGSFTVSILSVLIPILRLSCAKPGRLLIAEDNSNFASSPRHSVFMPKKKMPLEISLLGLFRFRKYYIKLLIPMSIFSMLLVTGCYLAGCYRQNVEKATPEFTIDFSGTGYTADEAAPVLMDIDGVCAVTRASGISASELNGNILVPSSSVTGGDFAAYPRNPEWKGTMMARYTPSDALSLSLLDSFYGYDVEGDPEAILSDPHSVILFDSMDNRTVLDIKPGDRVMLSTECHVAGLLQTETEKFGFTVALSGSELLRSYFEACDYSYREYTVAAVVHHAPCDEELPVWMSFDAYRELTGRNPAAKTAEIFVEKGMSSDKIENVGKVLTSYVDRYRGIRVERSGATEERSVAIEKNTYGLLILLSVLVFLVCPILWFFSQILFYKKRSIEFDIYRALGAVSKEIGGLFLTDGIALGILSALLYVGFSYLSVFICCNVMNRSAFRHFIGNTMSGVRFDMSIPLPAFLCGLVLSVGFALGASLWSRHLYRKKESEHISVSFSEE